jgi:hypothetical protein
VPDKYERVVIDGIIEFAYQFDPELGSATEQNARYKDGVDRMVRDNGQIIAENKTPISHRVKYRPEDSDAFPLGDHFR